MKIRERWTIPQASWRNRVVGIAAVLAVAVASGCTVETDVLGDGEHVAESALALAAPTNTSVFATAILAKHNAYRTNTSLQSVGLPPANPPLAALTWNQTRAAGAQQWAEYLATNGVWQHSTGSYGENIYYTASTSPISECLSTKSRFANSASLMWGNESLNPAGNWTGPYSVFPFHPSGPAQIGHYTQMIWGGQGGMGPTTSVGCGVAHGHGVGFPNTPFPYACYVVCQYVAPGNFYGVDIYPRNETCNGVDDNANGQVDENNPGGNVSCTVPGAFGACATGITACTGGSLVCHSTVSASPEGCNGVDDDCDGEVDEGNPEGGEPCFIKKDVTGEMTCIDQSLVCAYPELPPEVEVVPVPVP